VAEALPPRWPAPVRYITYHISVCEGSLVPCVTCLANSYFHDCRCNETARTDDPVEKVEELKVDLPDPAISAGRSDEKAPPGAFDARSMGCKLTPDGRPARWFYIPGWYTIGPFPNPNRVNIAKAFPPEFGIDLDAVYRGPGGRPLRWEYGSSTDYRMAPGDYEEYSVYYAYSRVWSARETSVWIAVGADDRCDVRINALPVWRSTDELKAWVVDEGYRKVFLKQGDNTILVRIENGRQNGGFSFLVCTNGM